MWLAQSGPPGGRPVAVAMARGRRPWSPAAGLGRGKVGGQRQQQSVGGAPGEILFYESFCS